MTANRTTQLMIRLTEAEAELIRSAATLKGLTISAYARMRLIEAAREDALVTA